MRVKILLMLVISIALNAYSIALAEDNYENNDTMGDAFDISYNWDDWLSSIDGFGEQWDDDCRGRADQVPFGLLAQSRCDKHPVRIVINILEERN